MLSVLWLELRSQISHGKGGALLQRVLPGRCMGHGAPRTTAREDVGDVAVCTEGLHRTQLGGETTCNLSCCRCILQEHIPMHWCLETICSGDSSLMCASLVGTRGSSQSPERGEAPALCLQHAGEAPPPSCSSLAPVLVPPIAAYLCQEHSGTRGDLWLEQGRSGPSAHRSQQRWCQVVAGADGSGATAGGGRYLAIPAHGHSSSTASCLLLYI